MMPQQNYAAFRQLKEEIHSARIGAYGIFMCKERSKIAQYALFRVNKPIDVSQYQLTQKIPAALKGKLLTIKQIEKEPKNISESKSL